MRISKLAAPVLMGILLGASALAADLATIDTFTAVGALPQPMVSLCVTASGSAIGQPCMIMANGVAMVGCVQLQPGTNMIMVPNLGPSITFYTASGPGIEVMSVASPGNPGIN